MTKYIYKLPEGQVLSIRKRVVISLKFIFTQPDMHTEYETEKPETNRIFALKKAQSSDNQVNRTAVRLRLIGSQKTAIA